MDKKTFAMAVVKEAKSTNPNGEFEVILSAETLDRDGEVIDAKAFEPLPDSIPFHAFHDFHDPVGRGVPFYDGDVLKARGTYASTPRAQEIRTLVSEGVIGHTSVGFMAAERKDSKDDGTPHVTSGELLEGSFVSVPSNREAAVVMAKSYQDTVAWREANGYAPIMGGDGGTGVSTAANTSATTSTTFTLTSGAFKAPEDEPPTEPADEPAPTNDAEAWQAIHDLALENGATCTEDQPEDDDTPTPVTPAPDEAGKSPASEVVEMARARAVIARHSLTG